ncbi:deoxyribose-phosphate aldolase [Methanobacterium sp. ACI-7]|uniref:deoxyribose-phosphate aldolase n=1 Tax=unclassified Methanobacterium TaxID=2627676 RepID=UPI0039C1B201
MNLKEFPEELAKIIDHTNLKPDACLKDIEKLCEEAKNYNFASVCVNPTNVSYAAHLLYETDIKICTVISFPLGANTSKIKFFETKNAVESGASEIDMVMNIGALKSGHIKEVESDINSVVAAAGGFVVKVIIETALLTEEEKINACNLVKDAGAHFIKTSTGFGYSGATVEDIKLIKETVGSSMGIKASGGIRDLKTALLMIDAGATRIGTSSGVQIMKEINR